MRPYLWVVVLAACGGSSGGTIDGSGGDSGGSAVDASGSGSGCTLAANTTPTGSASASGCAILDRDTSACEAARTTAGLTGVWLHMSCRVTLSLASGTITATTDGQPDYESNYFPTTDPCHETYTGGIQNPNLIAAQTLDVQFAQVPSGTPETMRGAVVGLAVNGVPIFANFAAPGDDIYQEAKTFDRCGGHPQNTGEYHYHGEPSSISDDDSRFIGVMRDGNPIYGRRDMDNSLPTDLDADGGHTGVTADSATAVYHYHVNLQTSTASTSSGQQQYFLTTGIYHNAAPNCADCN
jgi:hypothetical protein